MPSDTRLHIISFDNPFPPDYGGVIDVFYKLKHLHALGVKITLHAFEYGRAPQKELETYCENVYYYKRKRIVSPLTRLPYIVASRKNNLLLDRLLKDDATILFEGLHTCIYLNHPLLQHRKKLVRMHNIEHDYYGKLMEVETNWMKRLFFSQEAKRLLKFEEVLKQADSVLAISPNDQLELSSRFNNIKYIKAFHPNEKISGKPGKGEYAFYHGKLSVGENDEAAKFLVESVFSKTDIPLYIAGNNPSEELKKLVAQNDHVSLFDNLNTEQISDMMANAQVNIIPTFQATGIKLKLINVLYQGRFVLANTPMVANTGCESLCEIANTPEEFIHQLKYIFTQTYSDANTQERTMKLNGLFDNNKNAKELITLI